MPAPILTTAELGTFPNVWLSENPYSVGLIDQSLLPNEEIRLSLNDADAMFEAIYTLRVRGAPAIGIFAAYAIFVLSSQTRQTEYGGFYAEFKKNKDYLDSSRPTAVDLRKQLDRMERVVSENSALSVAAILDALLHECCSIQRENLNMLRVVSEFGFALLKSGDGVLTHCNAGPLAGSPGLGAILLAQERGLSPHAYVDETRPLLQGARLTAYELSRAGVDTTLICDNMAAT
ncbi:MAG: S-methyl-5-thioribose-1-phosphate isomerase, partial [Oscillospiraceae bacterium]|nr:S-methyl-5-thioribose-1-phosphate isomerase [Oscillospiraceae bacterium]